MATSSVRLDLKPKISETFLRNHDKKKALEVYKFWGFIVILTLQVIKKIRHIDPAGHQENLLFSLFVHFSSLNEPFALHVKSFVTAYFVTAYFSLIFK
jgi:hypothetical protein